jgi:phospholipase C
MKHKFVTAVAASAMLAGCAGAQSGQSVPLPNDRAAVRANGGQQIKHIIVIVQENRTVDDLFQFLPGARTQSWGYNSKHQQVALQSALLTAPYDIRHNHRKSWETEYNGGAMDGFDKDHSNCRDARACPPPGERAYGYVPKSDVQPYYDMAEAYAFADEMFQTSQGPSLPAHQYIVSGTSSSYDGSDLRVAEDPGHQLGGCDSPSKTKVRVISENGSENHMRIFPCFNRSSIFTLLDAAGISWKYYQNGTGAGLWHAVDALKPIWQKRAEYQANVVSPPPTVLTDISGGKLASVVFVTPTAKASDHAGVTDGTGPSWVASVVNAVGKSQYWNSTAVVVTWDDWGGWYDHVKPTVRNSYELGFRVPLIVVSPYAKKGFVSHVPYEFGSILKFIEKTFGLASLGTTDQNANDLTNCFDFRSSPRPFAQIRAKYSTRYFETRPLDSQSPDDDD